MFVLFFFHESARAFFKRLFISFFVKEIDDPIFAALRDTQVTWSQRSVFEVLLIFKALQFITVHTLFSSAFMSSFCGK